ncbi:MAG TPA: hypothetical protein VHM89_10570, partial [Acidimicrobiales bacterium]|nr:hypothetical protein [Acidimicrobiales bacterium]
MSRARGMALVVLLGGAVLAILNVRSHHDACPRSSSPESGRSAACIRPGPSLDVGGPLSLPRVPWESGPSYWKKFAKADAAGWDDPSFFPIAVHLSKPSHVDALKSV